MKNTQLLLINDMCGYGKVALSAMLPVLSHMGYRIHNLPTALVSDTLNYPKFYIHDTTEYVRQSLAIWEELGFEFDAISTGRQRQALRGRSRIDHRPHEAAGRVRRLHGAQLY